MPDKLLTPMFNYISTCLHIYVVYAFYKNLYMKLSTCTHAEKFIDAMVSLTMCVLIKYRNTLGEIIICTV